MSILLVSDNFPPRTGGSGRWFWEIYRRLPRERVVVAAGEHPRQGEFDRTHDLRVARLPLTLREWGLLSREGLRDYAAAVGRLRRLVRDYSVRVVHCSRCLPEGVMCLALRWLTGVPYLCYVHGEDVAAAGTSREQHFLARQVLRRAACVIANSHNTERILLDEWDLPVERVRVLHPGVDTERFVPAPRDYGVRGRLGWGERRAKISWRRVLQQLRMPWWRRSAPESVSHLVVEGFSFATSICHSQHGAFQTDRRCSQGEGSRGREPMHSLSRPLGRNPPKPPRGRVPSQRRRFL